MRSLKAQQHRLADINTQLDIIEHGQTGEYALVPFQQKLEQGNLFPLRPTTLHTFQVNIGKMCNQTCRHCHVDAGPDRREIMTRETMQQCLDVLKNNPLFRKVDITGGAPEMNEHFRWFVDEIAALGREIIVRCNLTILLANRKYHDLPRFYRNHHVEVVSSLPFYSMDRTDRQRGKGVFEDSIRALQMLNAEGYGIAGSGLILNLVYNPAGAFLPPSQLSLEQEYRLELRKKFAIEFNNLFVITNMPINRYLDYLVTSGNYEAYMEKLVGAYNPAAAANVMCRNTISVGWDGFLYDCDFNQMLELKVNCNSKHIGAFDNNALNDREIILGQHCFGCTAGSGSSCGGAVA